MCVHVGFTGRTGKPILPAAAVGLFFWALCLGAIPVARGADGRDWVPVKDAHTHVLLRLRADSDDPIERIEAVRALCRIADPEDLQLLARLLRDPDGRVRAEAVSGLAGWEPDLLWDEVPLLVEDPDSAVRHAWWVAVSGSARFVEDATIMTGLSDSDATVRVAAVAAAPLPEMASTLTTLRDEDESAPVRVAAWKRLTSGSPAHRDEALTWAFARAGSEFSIHAAHALTEDDTPYFQLVAERMALHRSPDLRALIDAVGRAHIAEAVPPLLRELNHYGSLARLAACRVLGSFDLPDVIDTLAFLLREDPDGEVVRAASEALAVHPSSSAVPALADALESDRIRTRQWAVRAVGLRADPGGIPGVLTRVSDSHPDVREAALIALRRIDPHAATPVLARVRKALRSDHTGEAVAAVRLLGSAGDMEELPFMRKHLMDIELSHVWQLREAILDALTELGYGQLVERVIEIAAREVMPPPPGDPDWTHDMDDVRRAALRYLARFGEADQAESLRDAFTDVPAYAIRIRLAELMSQWTGTPYEAVRTRVYPTYSVESLAPAERAERKQAGIRRMAIPASG